MRARLGQGAAWLLGAFILVGVVSADSTLPSDALKPVRHLAVQHNGREKPFDSFAREELDRITGNRHWGGADPVMTMLLLMADPQRWQGEAMISVPFVPLREALGLDRKTKYVSYDELISTRTLMQMLPAIAQKQGRDEKLSMLENETFDLYDRFVRFSRIMDQDVAAVPPASTENLVWPSINRLDGYQDEQRVALQTAWMAIVDAVRRGHGEEVANSATAFVSTIRATSPSAYPVDWRLRLEVRYNRLAPFRVSRWIYLVAAIMFALALIGRTRFDSLGLVVLWLGCIVHVGGIVTRVVLGGRPPVSNFYETMLWLPLVAVVLALIFERVYRARFFGFAAALLAAVTLLLADHLPLDSSISPVVAVLRSTLWLTIHVLTIVASYGALALATVLAHIHGGLYLVRGEKHPSLKGLGMWMYRSIQVGVVLLAAGIMLGAVWANASWGRYWGWDPKETWALITLLWFLAVLHGRFAGWLRGPGVALTTIGGFLLLLMTYYGVSFYLVGLHSYAGGNAKPFPPLLIAYLFAESAFMIVNGVAMLRRRQLSRPA